MLLVWRDWKGVIFFELLSLNRTINSAVYCEQLDKLSVALQQKRPELVNREVIVFRHDNARPHTALTSREKLLQLGWEALPHPPYSPDLAPSDFHLFRSLQNSLNGKQFDSDENVKIFSEIFFTNKEPKFFEQGIKMDRLIDGETVVDAYGLYLINTIVLIKYIFLNTHSVLIST